MPAMRWWTRDSSTPFRSAPIARLPTTATSRSCPAIESRPSLAIESRPASIIRSPTLLKLEEMRCSSAVNTLSVTNPIRHRGCRLMRFSTSTPHTRSTRRSRFTRAPTISSITAMRPMELSLTPAQFPISRMAARHSRTRVPLARRGRAPSMWARGQPSEIDVSPGTSAGHRGYTGYARQICFGSGLTWSAPMGIADPAQRQRPKNPERNDGDHSGSADRTLPGLVCHGAILNHDLFGNQPHHKPDAEGHDDQIVEITDDRNEVRNEVDRRERISGSGNSEKFGIPRHTRIARSEIDCVTVAVEPARPSFHTREHEVLLKSRDARWQIASARHVHIPGADGGGQAHVAMTWPDDRFLGCFRLGGSSFTCLLSGGKRFGRAFERAGLRSAHLSRP